MNEEKQTMMSHVKSNNDKRSIRNENLFTNGI